MWKSATKRGRRTSDTAMKQPLWNPIINQKCYVILDEHGNMICEQLADSEHLALRQAKEEPYSKKYARTAILKTEHERTEKLQDKWIKAAKKAEM
jgi:hypothetical protein